MSIGHQSRVDHDPMTARAANAGHAAVGKQTQVQAVEASASRKSGKDDRQATEDRAILLLGKYSQRYQTAYEAIEDKVGKSKDLKQAVSTILGAAGSLFADKAGAEAGKEAGKVLGEIATKVAGSLGAKFPDVAGDKNAHNYLVRSQQILTSIIDEKALTLRHQKLSIADLEHLIALLQEPSRSQAAINKKVHDQLDAYQRSVELMYVGKRNAGAIGLVAQSPVLGHVPDPKRGNVHHLAVVQETTHPSGSPTWALLSFVADGLGPEADAVMKARHPKDPIHDFDIIHPPNVMSGLKIKN